MTPALFHSEDLAVRRTSELVFFLFIPFIQDVFKKLPSFLISCCRCWCGLSKPEELAFLGRCRLIRSAAATLLLLCACRGGRCKASFMFQCDISGNIGNLSLCISFGKDQLPTLVTPIPRLLRLTIWVDVKARRLKKGSWDHHQPDVVFQIDTVTAHTTFE